MEYVYVTESNASVRIKEIPVSASTAKLSIRRTYITTQVGQGPTLFLSPVLESSLLST
jgi:hypothetical protein